MCDTVGLLLKPRLDANPSQIIRIIGITAVKEMNRPVDEIVFHTVYAPG